MPAEPSTSGLPPRPSGAAAWWKCQVVDPAGAVVAFAVVEDGQYPDGDLVRLGEQAARLQATRSAICWVRFDDEGRVTDLDVPQRVAPRAPRLWFVEVPETAAQPPAVNLMAFTGHGRRPGELVAAGDWSNLDVTNGDQVGAVRWYPVSGEVDQIYVAPPWRRRGVATVLLSAMGTLNAARGWPRVWGDGQRTRDGEALRNAGTWSWRTVELTHLAPPMTPGEG